MSSAIASVVLGGSIIEKHFNLDDKKKTVDSFFSLGVENFKNMVKEVRRTELALGRINYNICYSSRKNMNSRRSIYISNKINQK